MRHKSTMYRVTSGGSGRVTESRCGQSKTDCQVSRRSGFYSQGKEVVARGLKETSIQSEAKGYNPLPGIPGIDEPGAGILIPGLSAQGTAASAVLLPRLIPGKRGEEIRVESRRYTEGMQLGPEGQLHPKLSQVY